MSEVETFYKEVKFLKDKFGIKQNCSIYEFAATLIKEINRLESVITNISHKGEENDRTNSI